MFSEKKIVLFVAHFQQKGSQDGISHYLRKVKRELTREYDCYILFPTATRKRGLNLCKFDDASMSSAATTHVCSGKSLEKMVDEIRTNLSVIHIQEISCFSQREITSLISWISKNKQVRVIYSVHDISPFYDCTNGFPNNVEICEQPADVKFLYEKTFAFCDAVVCPSKYIHSLLCLHYPQISGYMIPHETISFTDAPKPQENTKSVLRIAVCGAFVKHKGSAVVCETIETLAARQSLRKFEFHIFGYVRDHESFKKCNSLAVFHGAFQENTELQALLQDYLIDVIWFPAQTPESYSYCLSAAIETNLTIVLPNIGAFSERALSHHRLVDWSFGCTTGEFWATFWTDFEKQPLKKAGNSAKLTSQEGFMVLNLFAKTG